MLKVLDNSHLVERVPGFSLEHHAVWQHSRLQDVAAPSWMALLQQDIRKLPTVTERRVGTDTVDFSSQSTTPQVLTTNSSETGNTVISSQESTPQYGLDGAARSHNIETVIRHLPKKSQKSRNMRPTQQYWSEYDHPEDSDDENGYVLYIDPHEESWFDKVSERISNLFRKPQSSSHGPLLSPTRDLESYGSSADSDEDEDHQHHAKPLVHRHQQSNDTYGTILLPVPNRLDHTTTHSIPRLPLVCIAASIIILAIGFVLASTGRRKQASQVDAGIIFAVASSVGFAILGVLTILKHRRRVGWVLWTLAVGAMCAVAVASGVLLGWTIA